MMQIAGSKCGLCGRTIVFASEGKFCPGCKTYSHLACDSREQCAVCHEPFQRFELPKPDPLRDAIVPRPLRPAQTFGPLAIALALMIPALLFLMVWLALLEAMEYGG